MYKKDENMCEEDETNYRIVLKSKEGEERF